MPLPLLDAALRGGILALLLLLIVRLPWPTRKIDRAVVRFFDRHLLGAASSAIAAGAAQP